MHTAVRYIENSEYARFGTYLREQHFFAVFLLALLLHGAAAATYYLMPQEEVLEIPVRVLNVKLGGQPGASAITSQDVNRLFAKRRLAKQPSNPQATAQPSSSAPVVPSRPKPVEPKVEPVNKVVEPPKAEPVKKVQKPKPTPKKVKTPEPKVARAAMETPKPKAEITPPPVVENPRKQKTVKPTKKTQPTKREIVRQSLTKPKERPRRYVRSNQLTAKVGDNKAPSSKAKRANSGSLLGNSSSAGADIQRRYTQTISLWIDKHKVYPEVARAAGEGGKVILRIRINRQGRILRFLLEKSSGSEAIDRAITQMIDAANPLPAVPMDYPDNKPYLEFLIPINFIP